MEHRAASERERHLPFAVERFEQALVRRESCRRGDLTVEQDGFAYHEALRLDA
ncbi:hypothetical protein J2X35_001828 [Mesorhizobium sp. BE184]|nr:hypothetical protein [Mesorhizobium sp. BE184]